jgi:hypothetical protein
MEAAMRCGLFGLLAVALGGCEPMAPSGRPFEPVTGPAPVTPAGDPGAPGGRPATADADPFADDREEEPAPAPTGTGITVLGPDGTLHELPSPSPGPARSGEPPSAPAAGAVPVWDAAMPLPDVSFGVQLVAVIPDRFPPRAVLALPDGREIVVTPGAMLPEQGIVVLAIGQNGARVAHVTPSGYQARVVTETISVLSPREAPPN